MKFQIIADEVCLDFINTLDNRVVPAKRLELLLSYRDLLDWAQQAAGLSAAQHSILLRIAALHPKNAEATLAKAVELRECLYRVMTAVARRRRVSEGDLQTLNRYLQEALSQLELRPRRGGYRLELPHNSPLLNSVLWPIARSASDLLTSNDLPYVRECGVGTCRWLFVDRSRNHSRRWCDMRICGNRMKARKFYRRLVARNG